MGKLKTFTRGKFINIFPKHILFELFILEHYSREIIFLKTYKKNTWLVHVSLINESK